MISPVLMNKIKNDLDAWETPVNWMYLDSQGYVTVGCGTKLPDIKSAESVKFYNIKTKLPASKLDIAAAWKKIHDGSIKQKIAAPANKFAALHYKNETDLRIKINVIHSLRDIHIKENYLQLKQIYPKFDTFPDNIKIALFDMIYNLGSGRASAPHRPASGLREYVLMNKAVNGGNWAEAAKHCFRHGIPQRRNIVTKNLFLSADSKKLND